MINAEKIYDLKLLVENCTCELPLKKEDIIDFLSEVATLMYFRTYDKMSVNSLADKYVDSLDSDIFTKEDVKKAFIEGCNVKF